MVTYYCKKILKIKLTYTSKKTVIHLKKMNGKYKK